MADDTCPTCLTSTGNRYSYSFGPSSSRLPTLLFLHGFPSHKHDWVHQKRHFVQLGYGVLLVDLLGFGLSDSPDDQAFYRYKPMSDDIIDILNHVQANDPVIGVAHDLGVMLLSRTAIFRPRRFKALVYLSVGPHQLGRSMDVDAINRFTKQMLGHEYLGYIAWMVEDPAAQEQLEKHAESAMRLMFSADPATWDHSMRPLGAMEKFVTEDRDAKVGDWFPLEMQREHLKCYKRPGGNKGAIKWYKNMANNESLPDEEAIKGQKQHTPSLLIASQQETPQQKEQVASWHTELEDHALQSGHWIHLEKAGEINKLIEDFITSLSATKSCFGDTP